MGNGTALNIIPGVCSYSNQFGNVDGNCHIGYYATSPIRGSPRRKILHMDEFPI